MMTQVGSQFGGFVFFDPDEIKLAYGAHAVRVDAYGDIQVLIITPEEAEWVELNDAELVQSAGKPIKARKQ